MNINRYLTPHNHSEGRYGNTVAHVIVHTMVGTIDSAQSRFFAPNIPASRAASAHYGIALSGEIRQWVSEGDTAWQAGNFDENMRSIGIEHEDNGNYNDGVRTNELYNSSIDLIVDICRRYGLSADCIHIHKEFSNTGCPDGLDVQRIRNGVSAILNGQAPANIPPRSNQPVEAVTDTLTVVNPTVYVRLEPNTSSQHGVANTPDGELHQGNTVQITGVVRSEDPYGDGRNLWGRSIHGRFFWLGGTNYYDLHPEAKNPTPAAPAPAEVAPADVPDFVPFTGTAMVTAGIGAHVRTGPGTDFPLNPTHTANGVLNQGESFAISGYKYAQDPYGDGRNLWVRSQYGNWIWAANLNVDPAIPAQNAAPAQVQAEAPATPAPIVPADPAPEAPKVEDPHVDETPAQLPPPATRALDGIQSAEKAIQRGADNALLNYEEAYADLESKVPQQYKLLNLVGQLVASLVAHISDIRGFLAYRKAKSDPATDSHSDSTSNNIRSN